MITLEGGKSLVAGIADENSTAHGCARAFRRLGAELAVTCVSEKPERSVRPLAEARDSPLVLPCDVREPGQLDAMFARIRER